MSNGILPLYFLIILKYFCFERGEMNMSTKLNEIHDYLRKIGTPNEEILEMDKTTFTLAKEIAQFAHRIQERDNGEPYFNHPMRLVSKFEKILGEDVLGRVDENALSYLKIPYKGVKEVCLLHDVIEDTELKFDDLEQIFAECGFGDYYSKYIKIPLKYITHIKSEDYEIYVMNTLQNSTASMVKMLDIEDNLALLDLTKFKDSEFKRANTYLKCFKYINDRYNFIENCTKYRRMMKKLAKVEY